MGGVHRLGGPIPSVSSGMHPTVQPVHTELGAHALSRRINMPVKLGFIGVGGISRSHLRDLQAMPEEAEVVGMVDVNREQAEMMAAENGARVYDSADALAREVDALYICLPPFAHGE